MVYIIYGISIDNISLYGIRFRVRLGVRLGVRKGKGIIIIIIIIITEQSALLVCSGLHTYNYNND